MTRAKFGIEAEYALIQPDGRFADFTNTGLPEVQALLAPLPDHRHPELRVGDAGIRVKNWYVEGDERFDRAGRSTGFAVKGVEIRTPACPSIAAALASLAALRTQLVAELERHGWALAAIGFNPCTAAYRPNYARWERQFHAAHAANALPEVSTLSYGPDFNLSFAGDSPAAALARAQRLTFYSPWIVPFAFNAPFRGGVPWRGRSFRTFARTGARPAALVHLAGGADHPLAKPADPPGQHGRVEFKAFDMVGDDRLLAELFRLVLGIALADADALPGLADRPDASLHQHAAVHAWADAALRREAGRVLAAARSALLTHGHPADFPLLGESLATCRTPAHGLCDLFAATGRLFEPLAGGLPPSGTAPLPQPGDEPLPLQARS